MKLDPTEISLFVNALQLSVKTKINSIKLDKNNGIILNFSEQPKEDTNLNRFLRFFKGTWDVNGESFAIENMGQYDISKLTLFLHITRLSEDNVRNLVERDPSISEMAKKMGFKVRSHEIILSPKQAAQVIFERVEKNGLTIRQLAEQAGLTQVAISNFKAGKDIRLTNLLKIAGVLGLKIKIF